MTLAYKTASKGHVWKLRNSSCDVYVCHAVIHRSLYIYTIDRNVTLSMGLLAILSLSRWFLCFGKNCPIYGQPTAPTVSVLGGQEFGLVFK